MRRTRSVPGGAVPVLRTKVSLFLRGTSEDKAGANKGPGCTSGIRSEVVELKVGWEGQVLPRQAHVVEFHIVGVTMGQTNPGIHPGSSRPRVLLSGPFQNYQQLQFPTCPHAASPFSPFTQPQSYLEIRDGRREGPEEKETIPLFSVCPPTWALSFLSFQIKDPHARSFSNAQPWLWDQGYCSQCPVLPPRMHMIYPWAHP